VAAPRPYFAQECCPFFGYTVSARWRLAGATSLARNSVAQCGAGRASAAFRRGAPAMRPIRANQSGQTNRGQQVRTARDSSNKHRVVELVDGNVNK
jgi:hypothetical protein